MFQITRMVCWSPINFTRINFFLTPKNITFVCRKKIHPYATTFDDIDEPVYSDADYCKQLDGIKAKKDLPTRKIKAKIQTIEADNVDLWNNPKESIKQSFLSNGKSKNAFYLINEGAVETLNRHLKSDLQNGDIIFESHPGPGCLTNALLTETKNKIVAYEPGKYFFENLEKSLQSQNPGQLRLCNLDLLRFYLYYYHGKKSPETDKFCHLLDFFPKKASANDNSVIRMVGVVSNLKFFYHLILSFIFKFGFYDHTYPITMYLYVPYKIYVKVCMVLKTRISAKVGIPLNYYFKIELLDTYSKRGFYPIYTDIANKCARVTEDDMFYLIKISANYNLYSELPEEELENFQFFVSQLVNSRRKDTVISKLENYIPGLGPDLIKNGFKVFSQRQPKPLTEDQILLAYRIFSSHAAYKDSMFHHYRKLWSCEFGLKEEEPI